MWSIRPSVPRFSGPYTVGTTEYEIPISEIDTQTGPPDPTITTLKFRLFYPTSTPYTGQKIPWVPAPQRQWTEAFGNFLGASLGWSKIVNPMLSLLSYITIPAIPNAPLISRKRPFPLMIFSHGLAGNCNTYSSFCGSMASCGMIVAAIEHRDGSCPITMQRGADDKVASHVDYRKYPHTNTPEVFRARNAQMKTRMWELDLLFTTLGRINGGEKLQNYALANEKPTGPAFSSTMDFRPGRITWAGHSFGACTITQFIKSIYYNDFLPDLKSTEHEHDPDWQPLFVPRANSDLIKQITPTSPVTLLDVWTMPFRAPSIQWLWERPMPCHDTSKSHVQSSTRRPTTISIMSTEFYNWTEMLNRTRILMAANPLAATEEIARQSAPRSPKMPKLEDTTASRTPKLATPPNKHVEDSDGEGAAELDADILPPASLPLEESLSAAEPVDRSASVSPSSSLSSACAHDEADSPEDSPTSSTTSLSPSLTAKPAPKATAASVSSPDSATSDPPAKLYHIPQSAHLSQSDFGPLFPTLTRLLMKAADPVGTMNLNVRAVAQSIRNAGITGIERVDRPFPQGTTSDKSAGSKSHGWFSWLRGQEVQGEKVTGTEDEETEARFEEMRQDSILQEPGLARWKELDVPVVAHYSPSR
ncbi:Platelet-activating factor acetylhydrolase-like protein [Cyphellophora attinorum]|uniref:Putative phospholipase n=1 Tax=Cyphellophora attinorum TaxID=1664694 RepID=A0A0N1H7I2_9EURO|nr:Platelet-activating factor acetylhydrolase-like protein [Phialophora attinorum]KPI42470.1 Platelet-activating factor acetylhydrolase-like protein [Phialophora attinorum]